MTSNQRGRKLLLWGKFRKVDAEACGKTPGICCLIGGFDLCFERARLLAEPFSALL